MTKKANDLSNGQKNVLTLLSALWIGVAVAMITIDLDGNPIVILWILIALYFIVWIGVICYNAGLRKGTPDA